jgi:predicted nucleic acid-binding protein
MVRIRVSTSVYLDTNALIYANFYLKRPKEARDFDYYKEGASVVQALTRCREQGCRVFSTDLAYMEMHHNYYEWARLKQALELGAPPGMLFGEGRRMDAEFLKQPLKSDLQQKVLDDTVGWLETWDFRDCVEFKQPGQMPTWFPIARCIYAHYMATVVDCLHLAAAIALECNYFLTQDERLRILIAEMRKDRAFRAALRTDFGLPRDYGLPDAAKAQSLLSSPRK